MENMLKFVGKRAKELKADNNGKKLERVPDTVLGQQPKITDYEAYE